MLRYELRLRPRVDLVLRDGRGRAAAAPPPLHLLTSATDGEFCAAFGVTAAEYKEAVRVAKTSTPYKPRVQ